MSKTSKRQAAAAAREIETNSAETAQNEVAETALAQAMVVAAAEAAAALPQGKPAPVITDGGRLQITTIELGDLMRELPNPAQVFGQEVVAELKAQAVAFYGEAYRMAQPEIGNQGGLAYEIQGRVVIRPGGRLMIGFARSFLAQAYYAVTTALRDHAAWKLIDTAVREQRQTDWQRSRPGQDVAGVEEASWLDGDNRNDPSRAAADRAERSLMEAAKYIACAFVFAGRVSAATDGEIISTSVMMPKPAEKGPRPVTTGDRLRAAGGWVPAEAPNPAQDADEEAQAAA